MNLQKVASGARTQGLARVAIIAVLCRRLSPWLLVSLMGQAHHFFRKEETKTMRAPLGGWELIG